MLTIGCWTRLTDAERAVLLVEFGGLIELLDLRHESVDPAAQAVVEVVYGAVDEARLRALPAVRWVHQNHTGVERLLHAETLARRPLVTNTRGMNGYAMAEHVLAGIFWLARDFATYAATNPRGQWRPEARPKLVAGSTALLLGTGALAECLSPKLTALGVNLLGVNTTGRPAAGLAACFTLETIAPRLGEVDWLVVLLPGTPRTRRLVDGPFLARLKPGCGVVNVGRGAVIDQPALLAALDAGHLAGAVLDTVEPEPLPADSPLFTHPRVLVTCHQSWQPPGGPQTGFEVFRHNLRRWLEGRPEEMMNLVDLDAGY